MSNIFDSFKGKKGNKKFEKLTPDAKAKVLQTAIEQKVSGIMAEEISKAMITGMTLEREQIYNKYVEAIDKFDPVVDGFEKWAEEVNKLLSYLRMKHLECVSKQKKDGE